MIVRGQRTAIYRVDFYADDWLAGTMELTPEQRGVFITLCAIYFSKQGRVAENDRLLAGMCNLSVRKWRTLKAELISLGKIAFIDGLLFQERAEIELVNAMNAKLEAQKKGAKGGKKSAEIRANMLKRNKVASSPAVGSADSPDQDGVPALSRPLSPSPSPSPSINTSASVNDAQPAIGDDAGSTIGDDAGSTIGDDAGQSGKEQAQRRIEVGDRVLAAAGIDPAKWTGDYAIISMWLTAGFDVELDILPTVTRVRARKGTHWAPRSLGYFTGAITEAWTTRTESPLSRHVAASDRPPTSAEDLLAEARVPVLARLGYDAEQIVAMRPQHMSAADFNAITKKGSKT